MTHELSHQMVGLLFPAISLLMLAYTNRFFGLAGLLRQLIAQFRQTPDAHLRLQIDSLHQRISLIRWTQALGVLSLLLCTASLFGLYLEAQLAAKLLFGGALLVMLGSLLLSLLEVHQSVRALEVEIHTLDSLQSD